MNAKCKTRSCSYAGCIAHTRKTRQVFVNKLTWVFLMVQVELCACAEGTTTLSGEDSEVPLAQSPTQKSEEPLILSKISLCVNESASSDNLSSLEFYLYVLNMIFSKPMHMSQFESEHNIYESRIQIFQGDLVQPFVNLHSKNFHSFIHAKDVFGDSSCIRRSVTWLSAGWSILQLAPVTPNLLQWPAYVSTVRKHTWRDLCLMWRAKDSSALSQDV
jgi:hypothetical protein